MAFLECNQDGPVARLKLNRPEVRNAFNGELIVGLTSVLQKIERDAAVRVVVLSGAGDFFCAGADLNWMKSFSGASRKANETDARRLAKLLKTLNELSKPVVARVQGAAMGGGVGLVAACDAAVADEKTVFALSEVKLGLVPAVISPFVLAKIGSSAARRYFLTGEKFDSGTALRIGLIQERTPEGGLDEAVEAIVRHLLSSGPKAVAEAKDLIRKISGREPGSSAVTARTSRKIASLRTSPEAQEGMRAFLEKRKPSWQA